MAQIRRLVLDLLIPHDPGVRAFAAETVACDGVAGVNVVLIETDREVQNVKLTLEGDDIDDESVLRAINDLGGALHSIDEVACGDVLVEASETPQDGV
jgi:hypothetical protein